MMNCTFRCLRRRRSNEKLDRERPREHAPPFERGGALLERTRGGRAHGGGVV